MTPEHQPSPWYKDKPFQTILLFVLTLVANAVGRKFGFELNVEEIAALATAIIGFIVANKWKGAVVAKAAEAVKEAQAKVSTGPAAVEALKAELK